MKSRIPRSISGPIQVERHDFNDGMIGYEVWDHGKGTYHRLCTIYECDTATAKAEAEFIALALNNAIGALRAVEAAALTPHMQTTGETK